MIKYITASDVIEIHSVTISKSGGLIGYKDKGAIDSIINHMQNDDLYPDFYDKTSHLIYSLIKNHCFNDGNKRASIAASLLFINHNINMFQSFDDKKYIEVMEQLVILIASSYVKQKHIKGLITFILNFDKDIIKQYTELLASMNEFIIQRTNHNGDVNLTLEERDILEHIFIIAYSYNDT